MTPTEIPTDTSNRIVQSAANRQDDMLVTVNTTQRSTVAEIVNMAQLIPKHLKEIPVIIFELFKAAIKARSTMHAGFQKFASEKPDSEMEKSNAKHKHFIDALSEAFEALGGNNQAPGKSSSVVEEADDEIIFRNRFSALSLWHHRGQRRPFRLSHGDLCCCIRVGRIEGFHAGSMAGNGIRGP